MKLTRALTLFGLVLVLVTGSGIMASARHQALATGEIVICTGYGITTIAVDAEGNPVRPVVLCPDCMPALAALTDTVQRTPEQPMRLTPAVFVSRRTVQPTPDAPVHSLSRGPPRLV